MANGNFGGGDGSANNPYLVEDAQDFDAIRNNRSSSFKQTNDIDFSNLNNFDPIGDPAENFSGYYDGQNFTLKNITIRAATQVSLFGDCDFATIINLKIDNIDVGFSVENPLSSSALVYQCYEDCTIRNVHITNAKIEQGPYGSAGIVLFCNYPITIENCSFNGVFTNNRDSIFYSGVGGLVLDAYDNIDIINCHVKNTNFENLKSHFGGIIADCYGTLTNIEMCSFTGNVNLLGFIDNGVSIGGIFSNLFGTHINVENSFVNCSFSGNILGERENTYFSGIGYDFIGSSVAITNCYTAIRNSTNFNCEPYFDSDEVNTIVTNSYYDNDLNNDSRNRYATINPRTTEQMKMKSNFIDWDFTNIWNITENVTYPNFNKGTFGQLEAKLISEITVVM